MIRLDLPGAPPPPDQPSQPAHVITNARSPKETGMRTTRTPTNAANRFWTKVQKTDTCWLWTAAMARGGYGSYRAGGRTHRAHRYAYELLVGPVPTGLFLDHLCHNEDPTCPGGENCFHRRCVNPAHLKPVTPSESALRGFTTAATNAAKTHCAQGHEFTPENTYEIKPSRTQRNGARGCRKCRRAAHARAAVKRQTAAEASSPLTPDAVNAIVRNMDDPRYPTRITVYCDHCGVENTGEYMVREGMTSRERLAVARKHLVDNEGWEHTADGDDFCPTHAGTPAEAAR